MSVTVRTKYINGWYLPSFTSGPIGYKDVDGNIKYLRTAYKYNDVAQLSNGTYMAYRTNYPTIKVQTTSGMVLPVINAYAPILEFNYRYYWDSDFGNGFIVFTGVSCVPNSGANPTAQVPLPKDIYIYTCK